MLCKAISRSPGVRGDTDELPSPERQQTQQWEYIRVREDNRAYGNKKTRGKESNHLKKIVLNVINYIKTFFIH